MVEKCPLAVEDGYTADYVPEVKDSFAETYETILLEGEDGDYIDARSALDCTLYVG